jgi:RHS repeat-associated protein
MSAQACAYGTEQTFQFSFLAPAGAEIPVTFDRDYTAVGSGRWEIFTITYDKPDDGRPHSLEPNWFSITIGSPTNMDGDVRIDWAGFADGGYDNLGSDWFGETWVDDFTSDGGRWSLPSGGLPTPPPSTVCLWKKSMVYGFGQLLSEETPVGRTFIQSDQVGSPSFVTDAGGNVIGRTKNLPFGERFGSSGTQSASRYASHEDQPGSAIYMQARSYLPGYGRFAQPDPAYDFSSDGLNLYSYCSNNPVTGMDPTGMRDISGAPPWGPSGDRPHEPLALKPLPDGDYLGPNVMYVGFSIETPAGLERNARSRLEMGAAAEVARANAVPREIKDRTVLIKKSGDIQQNAGGVAVVLLLGIGNGKDVNGWEAAEAWAAANPDEGGNIVVILNPHGIVGAGIDKGVVLDATQVNLVKEVLVEVAANNAGPINVVGHSDGTMLLDGALTSLRGGDAMDVNRVRARYFGSPLLFSSSGVNVSWTVRVFDPVTWLGGSAFRFGAGNMSYIWGVGHSFAGYMNDAGAKP